MSTKRRPLFTLRTDELAGRGEEKNKLQRAIDELQNISKRTLLFYIAGDGGMGKTRLLEWVRDTSKRSPMTICTQTLDLYNSILRTDVDLIEQIYEDIENSVSNKVAVQEWFALYINLRDRFRRQQVGAIGGQGRGEVIQAFYAGWLAMFGAGYRLIILLDTVELLRFEDDPVRRLISGLEPVASTKHWVAEVVKNPEDPQAEDKSLPGVLFLLAGRREESKDLYGELCALARLGSQQPNERVIDLRGLARAGVDDYLSALAKKLEVEGYAFEAKRLGEDLTAEDIDAFYHLTGGSPISLALALQLFIEGDSMELIHLVDRQRSSLPTPLPNAQQQLQRALVKSLAEQQVFDAASTAIRYMSLTRKGLTPTRLQALFPVTTQQELESIFQELEDSIFVKKRPDGSLVLHDKVADWTEEGIYGGGQKRSKSIYQILTVQYENEIKVVDREIDVLSKKADPITSEAEQETGSFTTFREIAQSARDPFEHENSREFRQARRKRRNLLVDQMTYTLRSDPIAGYKQYFELAEEAFNVGRMDYESQIRSEFLSWWDHQEPVNSENFKNRPMAQESGLSEEYVWADFAVRAVQREYNNDAAESSPALRARQTVALVNKIFEHVEADQLALPLFTQTLLRVYADMANGLLAESDTQIEEVRTSFAEHIKQLDILLAESRQRHHMTNEDARPMPLEPFLILNAFAFANYEFGFFESNHGSHGSAIQHYTASLFPYRQLGFEINQARSLNDKAYSLAMVGDSDSAETAISDALNLRKRLGFSFLTALSYNTMAIVRVMGERPITAIRYGEYALRIFQGLSHDYGQMIANRALSEAYRRSAEFAQQDPRTELLRLEQALAVCTDAVSLARQILTAKDFFLAEVLDEFGCVYRDLARFRCGYPEVCGDKHQDSYDNSRNLLDEASAVARKLPSARSFLVDSMLNRAYLCYYQLYDKSISNLSKEAILSEAKQLVEAAIIEVPEKYRYPTDKEHATEDLTSYWALLAKAYSLLVRIARSHLQKNNLSQKDRAFYEEQLLRECSYTLYFRSLLQGNVRNVKKSHQAVYEALQIATFDQLKRLYDRADDVTKELGLPFIKKESLMRKFLRENFGVR